jgi:hypothetical protein
LLEALIEGQTPRFPAMTTEAYMAWFGRHNYDDIRETEA